MTMPFINRHPRPARILMTADTVGGVWTYSIELARALARRGVTTVLAAMGGRPSPDQCAEALAVPGLELHESAYRLPWMEAPWDDVAAAGRWLLDLAARREVELVHLNEPVFAALPWPVPTVVVGHSCVLSWWEAVHGTRAPAEWDRYREAMTAGLAAAGRVVAPTAAMLAVLERHYGVRGGTVVPNARTARDFPPAEKEPYVLAAGRLWDGAKNVGILTRVAPALPWPVYVAGDDRHPDHGGRAPTGHLHRLGRLAARELAIWLSRAAIFALPARYEPFGLGALEAGLAGCALVLGDIPSLREVWGDAATYVPPDDTPALQTALVGLVSDTARREAMAARARERALTYSPERMGAAYLALYAEALAAPRVSGSPAPTGGGALAAAPAAAPEASCA